MAEKLVEIGKRVTDYFEDTISRWASTFGADLEQAWSDPDKTIQQIVEDVAVALNERPGGAKNKGHCSLFIRVPISDRLKLVWSTVPELCPGQVPDTPHFISIKDNYDENWKAAFYSLNDKLSKKPAEQAARDARGLTGWVAVTGHPIRLNHENDKVSLERFVLDHPESEEKFHHYGQPIWGRRISEFHTDDEPSNRRFVAVPIQSAIDPKTTIGVLRYTCPDQNAELTPLDQAFVEGMARIISALENLKRVRTRAHRMRLAEARARQFELDGDFCSYLKFIADSTISEIASVYIRLEHKGETYLRLVDAYGLSKPIRDLRHKRRLHDHTEATQGLTWRLQETDFKACPSAAEAKGWAGLNTSVFYEEAFTTVGLSGFPARRKEHRQFVKEYRIQLLGGCLRAHNGAGPEATCGVLKVEFPRVFDAEGLYDAADKDFLASCSKVLAQELHRYQQLYDGSWFRNAGPEKATECLRLLRGAEKTALFDGLDENWKEAAVRYINDHKNALETALHRNELGVPDGGAKWRGKVAAFFTSAGQIAANEAVKQLVDLMIPSR